MLCLTVDEEGDLEPGEYEIRAKVDNFILCADQAHEGQIIGLPSGGEGCTFFVEKPAEPAEDEPPIYRIRAKSSGSYLRESASGDQMISAGFNPSSDSLGMSQFHVERYSTGVYRIQVHHMAHFSRLSRGESMPERCSGLDAEGSRRCKSSSEKGGKRVSVKGQRGATSGGQSR